MGIIGRQIDFVGKRSNMQRSEKPKVELLGLSEEKEVMNIHHLKGLE
jgi:hypothetical protein